VVASRGSQGLSFQPCFGFRLPVLNAFLPTHSLAPPPHPLYPPPDAIALPDDAPLACPAAVASPMPQASNVLHTRTPSMSCEGRDAAGNPKRVPLWTLMTKGDAPEAGPPRRPAAAPHGLPSRDPAVPGVPRAGAGAGEPRPAGGRSGLGAVAAAGIALASVAGVALIVTATLFLAPIVKVRAC
jgi:hypothetical protein